MTGERHGRMISQCGVLVPIGAYRAAGELRLQTRSDAAGCRIYAKAAAIPGASFSRVPEKSGPGSSSVVSRLARWLGIQPALAPFILRAQKP
jgi:hypothetical protein